MNLVIDIGNSFTKFAFFENHKIGDIAVMPSKDWLQVKREISFLKKHSFTETSVCSVSPQHNLHVKNYFKNIHNIEAYFIDHKKVLPFQCLIDQPETIGADRLANVMFGFHKTKRDFLVIDIGTYLTIDCFLVNKGFVGGVIFPGLKLCQRTSLTSSGNQFHKFSIMKTDSSIGNNTISALQSGHYNGFLNLIKGFIMQISKEFKTKFKVFATGGDFKLFETEFQDVFFDKNLTLKGIDLFYDDQSQQRNIEP